MMTLAITGDLAPQMIQRLKDLIKGFDPKLRVELMDGLSIPTDETAQILLKPELEICDSHADLVRQLEAEIKAEQ